MNSYSQSDGTRIKRSALDLRIRQAKAQKLEEFKDEHGYHFCEMCGINANSGLPIDCSHEVSVKECLETGRAELAFCVFNIKLRCRKCHQKHDKTTIF